MMQRFQLSDSKRSLRQREREIDRAPISYLRIDADCRIVEWNSAAEKMFGFRKAEALGMSPPFEKFLPSEYWPDAEKIIARLKRGDMSAHSVNENLTRDGRRITCEWTNTPIFSRDGEFTGTQCWARDVTDVRRAQSLSLLGKLASGTAHEFSNLAQVILTTSELLQSTVPPADPLYELADRVRRASLQATRVTQKLRDIAVDSWTTPTTVNVRSVLEDIQLLLRNLMSDNVSVDFHIDTECWPVKACTEQLQRVILNLALNSRDAMPCGGQLTIEARNVTLDDDVVDYPGVRAGDFLMLSVRDTGRGMDDATLARVFEPFFTTKGEKGIGIGLAIARGIVHRWDGHVFIQSKQYFGTSVEILLPRDETAIANAQCQLS